MPIFKKYPYASETFLKRVHVSIWDLGTCLSSSPRYLPGPCTYASVSGDITQAGLGALQ